MADDTGSSDALIPCMLRTADVAGSSLIRRSIERPLEFTDAYSRDVRIRSRATLRAFVAVTL